MTAEHKYEMTISLQIVEHLGLNLYSNTSAVISEAVANAWDADAKTVEITLEKDCITIKDDGCGMDTDDINNKYLTVGYQKRHLVPITPMHYMHGEKYLFSTITAMMLTDFYILN